MTKLAEVPEMPVDVGKRLRRWRLATAKSQKMLGASAGVTSHTVQEWERGRHVPKPWLWPHLWKTCGASLLEPWSEKDEEQWQASEHKRRLYHAEEEG